MAIRVTIACIGRIRSGPEANLVAHYLGRLPWPSEIIEREEKRVLPPAERRTREGARLLELVPPGAAVVALDETGRDLTSAAFAAWLAQRRDAGATRLICLIGGDSGLSDAVRRRADLLLSFGRQTWPHRLVRVMLAEQLYRAHTILIKHPYHRGAASRNCRPQ